MSLSNPINPPLVNEAVAKTASSGLAVDENQTKVNQIHGINPAGSTGAGIPKPVSNVGTSIANASLGATSTINVRFQRDPSDNNFSRVVIYAKGYQGNNSPVQVGSSADSPATVILNNTGESVSLILQSVGNGGVSPLASSPSYSIKLPGNVSGGAGATTKTSVTTTDVQGLINTQIIGSGTTIVGLSGVEVAGGGAGPALLALNLSTEGTVDWIAQSGNNTASQIAIESSEGWTWKLNGLCHGRFRVFVINSNESPGGGNIANAAASALELSANTGDMRYLFANNPNRSCTYNAPNNSATLGCGTGIELIGDGVRHTYKIYCYLNKRVTCQVTAHATDGSASDVVLMATESTNQGAVYAFSFNCKIPVGSSVVFQAIATALNSGDTFGTIGIQAVTVFTSGNPAPPQSTTGILALQRGGTGSDLSATGGASQVVKQSLPGAALTVGQLAFSDISGAAVAAQIPTLDASKITTGQLALARGGTNADLSATGGTSQVLKQTSVGGNVSVAQLAASDLNDGTTGSGAVVKATSPTLVTPVLGVAAATSIAFGGSVLSHYDEGTFTPTFTNLTGTFTATGFYIRIGNLVWVEIKIATTPSTGVVTSTANSTLCTNNPFTPTVDGVCFATDDAVSNFGNGWIRSASNQIWLPSFTSGFNIYIAGQFKL